MYAQLHTSFTNILRAKYAAASGQSNEVVRLADEKGAALWKALGTMEQGCVLALSGKASEAIQMITSGDHHISVNRVKSVFAILFGTLVQGPCGARPT